MASSICPSSKLTTADLMANRFTSQLNNGFTHLCKWEIWYYPTRSKIKGSENCSRNFFHNGVLSGSSRILYPEKKQKLSYVVGRSPFHRSLYNIQDWILWVTIFLEAFLNLRVRQTLDSCMSELLMNGRDFSANRNDYSVRVGELIWKEKKKREYTIAWKGNEMFVRSIFQIFTCSTSLHVSFEARSNDE